MTNHQHQLVNDLRPFLLALLRAGIRKADIARRLGVSRAAISDASRPSEKPWAPSYPNGVALIRFHSEVCGASDQVQSDE